jgi:hypothetical protein
MKSRAELPRDVPELANQPIDFVNDVPVLEAASDLGDQFDELLPELVDLAFVHHANSIPSLAAGSWVPGSKRSAGPATC